MMQTTTDERLTAIRRGRDYLREHHWVQGEYFKHDRDDMPNIDYCDVVGALAVANGWTDSEYRLNGVDDGTPLDDVLRELNVDLPERFDDITVLNDEAVGKEQVLTQLDKTIRRLRTAITPVFTSAAPA